MNMGIGELGFNNIVFKRKFRFTFEVANVCGGRALNVPVSFVKLAARPSLSIEETEINFLNAKTWIPGKGSWETINVTYIDVANYQMQPLYQWLTSVYEFGGAQSSISLRQGSSRQDYSATGLIKLWDGCGSLLETWVLQNMWPTAVNFGELDYSSSDTADIELTLRYSDVQYYNNCPGFTFSPCCTPCS